MSMILTDMVPNSSFSYPFSIELILSILAIIISVAVAVGEYRWNKKINQTNLDAEFYKEIYFEYLMKRIPCARQAIRYNNEKVEDTGELQDCLNDLRRESLFFRYKDRDFYDKLKSLLQEFEDYLVTNSKGMDADEFSSFNNRMNKYIEEVYKIIMTKYKGG